MTRGLRVRAPAKVNLYLRVLRRRPDGYHDLETVFHTVGLLDEVRLAPAPAFRFTVSGGGAPAGPDNLCVRAWALLRARGPRGGAVAMTLIKRIPSGAGLGGGSADAAAVLAGLNRLWRLGLKAAALARLGARLGSDVPFFFLRGAAVGRGRGERLTPLTSRLRGWAVIAKPAVGVSTPWAYAALDRLPAGGRTCPAATLAGVVRRVERGDRAGLLPHNDFEQVVMVRHPVVGRLRAALLRGGAAPVFMTGSGSAVVGLCPGREPAVRLARRIARLPRTGAWAVPLAPLPLAILPARHPAA